MQRLALIIMLAAVAAVSCSVKEDRSGAPCRLTVYLDDADPEGRHTDAILSARHGGGPVLRDTIVISDHIPQGYGAVVPRDMLELSVLCGASSSYVRNDSLVVAYGRGYDRIWAFSALTDCDWDTSSEHVLLSKQHAVVTVRSRTEVAGQYPYDMRVRCGTCGMTLYGLEPVAGRFAAMAERRPDGTLVSVVPRQRDDAMHLDIIRPDGTVEISFQLGKMIAATGYDWTKESLDDIVVTIDYASMDLTVRIDSWTDEDRGTVII